MSEHSWSEHYLAAGFLVYNSTTLRASIFGSGCTATLLNDCVVELRAMTIDGCIGMNAVIRCDVTWSEERLFDALDQILTYLRPHSSEEIHARFGVPLNRAEAIVAESLHTSNFGCEIDSQPVPVGRLPYSHVYVSLERHCALTCAAESGNSSLIGWIALEYPGDDVRSLALQNPACSDDILLAVSTMESSIPDLLERPHLPTEVFTSMIEAETARYIRSTEPSEHHLTFIQFALHPSCPEGLAIGLLSHVAGTAQTVEDLSTLHENRANFQHLYPHSPK
ncbi:hypothetical protein [Rhodococcus globerulus]|uniref:hypothetical protein n=1 Tax=Rhodococcus globerulus TaxID=33008 RepID=UPI001C59BA6A|nr:hypothetical protein [Rhodococcus globerulus]QXW00767.1 hypothetical protein KYT97_20540 [Rhodococcus globerulus]